MKLYLMRHGPAEDQAPSGQDSDRALSRSGRERVAGVTEALAGFDEAPACILTSPLVRAVQTAEIVAVVSKLGSDGGGVEVWRELAPGGDPLQSVRRLAGEGRKRAMLVGHEPDLSELTGALLGTTLRRPFDKAMVVGLHIKTSGASRLRFVLNPRTLDLDPDERKPS